VLRGFKDFIMRGNVIELAIGIAIGIAFLDVVSAFGTSIINPLIAVIFGGGSLGGTFTIRGQVFDIGLLLTAILVFIITAAVIYFLIVVPLNAWRARAKADPAEETPESELDVLKDIRDGLRPQG
jgi:large conductance mechanosensitive channel